jgi:uncharacterized protein with ATP-grasp and redox domains
MRTNHECIPCFIKQALEAAKECGLDDESAAGLLRRTLKLVSERDWSLPPPVIARDVQRAIREMAGNPDPYLHKKIAATDEALALLPEIEETIDSAEDRFLAAVKVSIAGNVIDLGAKVNRDVDVREELLECFDAPLDVEAVDDMRLAVDAADSVLFLADNAGEIVFDRPLIEIIGSDRVTVAVRGGPTINDATLADADRAGLCDRFDVISSGTDTPGSWLDYCSPEFVALFNGADVVISKGQGNYETLSDRARRIYFLFLVKCGVVSKDLGLPAGTFVIKAGGGSPK